MQERLIELEDLATPQQNSKPDQPTEWLDDSSKF